MSVRVSSNQMVYTYKRALNAANARQDKLMEQGDGSKLHRPSDNAADYSKFLRFGTADAENVQYQDNVSTGVSWMKTTDASLVSMTAIQTTFKEKTVAAANDTNNQMDMKATAKEMMAEIQEVVSIGNTQQGDRFLFGGQRDLVRPFEMNEKEITRGLAKTLDEKQARFFSGQDGVDDSTDRSITQMLRLRGSDNNVYYLNTKDGNIYSEKFVEKGYKDVVAQNADAVVDASVHPVGKLAGWTGAAPTEKVSKYFKNTGELIQAGGAPPTLTGATANANNKEGIPLPTSFKFETIKQKIVTYSGDRKYISMVKKNGTTEPTADTVNVTGPDIFGTDIFDDANSGNVASGTAMLNDMLTVYTKVNQDDHHWLVTDGQTISDQAHGQTVNTEAKLGARQNLYDSTKEMLAKQETIITGDITDVSATDVAALAVKLMEAQTVYNMSLSLGARILPASLADYLHG